MTWSELSVGSFGGLVLVEDPENVGLDHAIDCLNTDPSDPTQLRCRPGVTRTHQFTDVARPIVSVATFGSGFNVRSYVVDADRDSGIYDQTGNTATDTAADATGAYAHFGTPVTEHFIVGHNAGLRYADGGTFTDIVTAPVATVYANYLAVTPTDNRLVAASAALSLVRFSDPGDPEAFQTNNYVYLDPNDGEDITGMVTWRELLFVFKETKFFVFYGQSVDNTGQPVFNYRSVKNTVGASNPFSNPHFPIGQARRPQACASPVGVFFLADDGIYLTTGEAPVKMSDPIEVWFKNRVDSAAANVPTNATRFTIGADRRRMLFGTSDGTFVYDLATRTWTIWGFNVSAHHFNGSTSVFATTTLTGDTHSIYQVDDAAATDDGAPIPWLYRTGVSDLGSAEIKTVRQLHLWGVGAPTLGVYVDHANAMTAPATVTLGSTVAAKGVQDYARLGTMFSLGMSGTSSDKVDRAVLAVRETRAVGVG